MTALRRWMSAATVVGLLFAATASFARNTERLKDFTDETGLASLGDVTDVLMSAAEYRGTFHTRVRWIFEKVKPGEIVASYFQRTYMVKVTITYDTKTYAISYKDSSNLNYDGRNIHPSYGRWVGALKTNIDRAFAERRAAASNEKAGSASR